MSVSKIFFVSVLFSFFSFPVLSQGTWVQKASIFSARAGAVGFSIGDKGYLGTGWKFGYDFRNDFWEWDGVTNSWTQKANFPGTPRGDAVGFSIGKKGYIGTGIDSIGLTKDFWEWDQAGNFWTKKSDFPGAARAFAAGFSIGTKGYIGMGGVNSGSDNDFWQWNQATDTWTQRASFPSLGTESPVCFVIGNKGYAGVGITIYNDFWEYDPVLNSWIAKAKFPGSLTYKAAGFAIGSKGYIGTGGSISGPSSWYSTAFYEWDQKTNTWTQKASYPHRAMDIDRGSFVIGCHGYFAGGDDSLAFCNDFWEYTPDNPPVVNATASGNTTICIGESTVLSAGGGINYLWSTGSSAAQITVSPTTTTTYSVNVSNGCNSKNLQVMVEIINSSTAFFSYEYDPCKNNCANFIDLSSNALSHQWNFGDGETSTLQNICHPFSDSANYLVSLVINHGTACADSFNLEVPFVMHDTTGFIYIPSAFSPNNDDENDDLRFFMRDDYCVKGFEISLYNQWGEKVFETTDLNDSWNGIYGGEVLNSQTFTYSCRLTTMAGKRFIRKGNVSLIR